MQFTSDEIESMFSWLTTHRPTIQKNQLISRIRELYGYKKPSNQIINDLMQLEEEEIDVKYSSY